MYVYRIRQEKVDGEWYFQPQVKYKSIIGFLYSWRPISMISFKNDMGQILYWTKNITEAEEAIENFKNIF